MRTNARGRRMTAFDVTLDTEISLGAHDVVPFEGRAEADRERTRSDAAATRPVPDREVAGAARGLGSGRRPRDLGLPRVRRGGGTADVELRRAARTAAHGDHDRHPLRDALESFRHELPRRPLARCREARAAEAGRALRRRARRAGLYVERAADRARSGRLADRMGSRRGAARAGARLAVAARRRVALLLEEREVVEGPRASHHRPARILGTLRLPQRRRLPARTALLVLARNGSTKIYPLAVYSEGER